MVRRKIKVAVAMSGGVDSSVAAFLLKDQGYEVVGVTMCLGVSLDNGKKPKCCGPQAIDDVRRVCDKIKIPHYVMDYSKELQEKVIKNFIGEYLKGRTPNPCVECNRYLKFGTLLQKAIALEFDFLATGHYARIVKHNNVCILKRPKDKKKDQTYFLYRIRKESLKSILFPLADYAKEQVRSIAKSINLPIAEKPQSQDICFIPDGGFAEFISARLKEIPCGPIVDTQGRVLGEHKGIAFYTVGQRQGLKVALGFPAYIIRIDYATNQIVLGSFNDACSKEFTVTQSNFISQSIKKKVVYSVKIRYNHKEKAAEIWPEKENLKVRFKQAQFAITPGQSAVFYDRDTVIGGGIIK